MRKEDRSPSARKKQFAVDARALLTLGRDSIKDHLTAIIELVKNSYDADATLVEVHIESGALDKGFIRIADNGTGMTERDIDTRWLRIGYSAKREDTITDLGRRRTGEKGIGRISADRLGANLLLRTKTAETNPVGLFVDWDLFNKSNDFIQSIDLDFIEGGPITLPSEADRPVASGTELIITELRQEWSRAEVEALRVELSTLTPPFGGVIDFSIKLTTNVSHALSGLIVSPFWSQAELRLSLECRGDLLEYEVYDRSAGTIKKDSLRWGQIIQRSRDNVAIAPSQPMFDDPPRCGPAKVTYLFFPRKADVLKGTRLTLSELRSFLDQNAGVRMYRDNIRVRPYGDLELGGGDWLSLAERKSREPAGAARKTFKVAASQLVGAVFISRDANPNLIDSSSREGLVNNEAFSDLRLLALGAVTLLEAHYHESFVRSKGVSDKAQRPREEVVLLKRDIQRLNRDLQSLASVLPRGSEREFERVLLQANEVSHRITQTQTSLNELISQASVLRGLATIGVASAVFGHEIQTAVDEFLVAASTSRGLLVKTPPNVDEAVDELGKAAEYAKRVGAWGAFALTRVQRDKRRRRRIQVEELVATIIRDLRVAFESVNIEVTMSLTPVSATTFAMDIEAVVLNLLTNAYSACQRSRQRRRRVHVSLEPGGNRSREGFFISVADSGPGVPEAIREKIWEPLFSTKVDQHSKPVGTGLGLSIVQAVVDELSGYREVGSDESLGGAMFRVWLPVS